MRLGEIKQKMDLVINESRQIVAESESIFGGQAYIVKNYRNIVDLITILTSQDWNDIDFSQTETIIKTHSSRRNKIQLTQEEYGQFSSYISSLNQKLPYFYSILDSMVEEQDEKCISIMLPDNIDSLKDFGELNKKFEEVLALFNVDGPFTFFGFDKGSNWLIVCAEGVLSCQFFISCLKVAQEAIKTRAEWFKSEKARLSYETCKAHSKAIKITDFKKTWLKVFLDQKIKEIIEKINERHGAETEELHTKLLKGTQKLIKQLGDGVEFHLSLNPPPYASEIQGSLEIDYKKIQQMRAVDEKTSGTDKPKELAEPKNNQEEK